MRFKVNFKSYKDTFNVKFKSTQLVSDGGYEQGYADGKQAQYDEFWDTFQKYGKRTNYRYGFAYSDYDYIRPKYKIIPSVTRGAGSICEGCSHLLKVEAEYFDFSRVPNGTSRDAGLYYMFANCIELQEIEDIKLYPKTYADYTFAWCYSLRTIAKFRVDENMQFSNVFLQCIELVNLIIEGTIGQNGLNLQHSTKLSKSSITSVINALSTTTSGLSINLSLTAVNKAFESGLNTNDGASTQEFLALRNSRSNWSINLV